MNYSRILENRTSLAMQESGFTDSYRFIHPAVNTQTVGYTWTTVGQGYTYVEGQGFVPVDVNSAPEYRDPYARIDFIYFAGSAIKPTSSKTIINHSSNLSRSFPEFPSDHGAVLTSFLIDAE